MKHEHCVAFRRKIPESIIKQAFVVTILSLCVVLISTLLLCIAEPHFTFMQLLFEVISAFGTVGLSTGITPHLSVIGKLIIILTMYVGRLGALTVVSLGTYKELQTAVYTEADITIA